MTCSACVGHVEKAVNRLEGIDKASVNLLTNSMQVEYDEAVIFHLSISSMIPRSGFSAMMT